ncbi:hypothetical protein HPB52_008134 [Rhipicephalus sanguineus]|uniref:Uncharacterized protein n=1 Tax=Rhipicephalus sanguineus TaxID=34632 RepID=A0A9D4PFE5_RHISA|nr:hypothetical protein HPB52_008134 [Rhipicephalus sanguineus]
MRTSFVLFFAFLFLFWRLRDYTTPLNEVAKVVGFTWIAAILSYVLSRLVWARAFVTEVSGEGRAVLITELSAVVANAGIGSTGLLEWLTMDTVVDVFNINVFGVLRVAKKFLPLLKKSKGRLVTVASPLGRFTVPMSVPYCMSKHAVVSMMDGLRRECHGKGVDFVTVEPSAYRTEIFKAGSTPMALVMRS